MCALAYVHMCICGFIISGLVLCMLPLVYKISYFLLSILCSDSATRKPTDIVYDVYTVGPAYCHTHGACKIYDNIQDIL